jgi:hypothetical protein
MRHTESDYVEMMDVEKNEFFTVSYDEITRLYAHWPRCGSINVEGGAFYLMRAQQQQYRRTYNPRALTVVFPDKWSALKADPEFIRKYTNPMEREIILAAFNPEYPSWDEAMTLLETQPFVALNSQIILGGERDLLTVYHKGRKSGIVEEGVFSSIGSGLPDTRAYKLMQGRITLC